MKRNPDLGEPEQYELAIPKPTSLIESLRAVGYSVATAIADIVDNSITANAANIWITFHWDGPRSAITILDDGKGMSEAMLLEAMRPGTQSPLEERLPSDLGRFGLGLKTASFSQCRSLTVASKESGSGHSTRRWDLDYVESHNEWRLLRGADEGARPYIEDLDDLPSGALVLWRKLDRIVDHRPATDESAHEVFRNLIEEVKEHLSMTFHRFISGQAKQVAKPLNIYVNGRTKSHLLPAWDPFLKSHPATQKSPEEIIGSGAYSVRIQGFVLPHKDRLSEEQYREAGGPRGWNAQQGFYIYRNDRILVPGDWLRLGRNKVWQKEEHYRLARLSIDISNAVDFEWSLDVKKSTARPPLRLRDRLTDLAEGVRQDARSVFFHRGEMGVRPGRRQSNPMERPWIAAERAGHMTYKVNRSHTVVAGVLRRVGPLSDEVDAMLRVIEETVPVERIWLDAAEQPGGHATPYEGLDQASIMADLKKALQYLKQAGYSTPTAIEYLRSVEPFNRYAYAIDKMKDEA
ncbi:MAG: ATP-binding protein [Betaproteobacteria bacterium]|jgi:hypothetical protein